LTVPEREARRYRERSELPRFPSSGDIGPARVAAIQSWRWCGETLRIGGPELVHNYAMGHKHEPSRTRGLYILPSLSLPAHVSKG
jgi:hypothetical protein